MPAVTDNYSQDAADQNLRTRLKRNGCLITAESARDTVKAISLVLALQDKQKYRDILKTNGSEAQETLNLLQTILDDTTSDTFLWRQVAVAAQRLSYRTERFPALYGLLEVQKLDKEAVSGGTFGEVYRGRYKGEIVCLKVIRIYQNSERKKIMKSYAREAILWRQLSHRNIFPFYGICNVGMRPCLVSPWAPNGNVNQYLNANQDADRLALTVDVTAGLDYLHAREIIHGDLKGANVLVDIDGRACLTDLGLSSIYDSNILDWSSQSAAASKGGTLRWQAPELLEEVVQNTKASDVYAWGCTCYEIFTGEVPYADTKPGLVALRKMQGVLPACSSRRTQAWIDAGLSNEIWNLFNKCWKSDPVKRPTIDVIQSKLQTGRESVKATSFSNNPAGSRDKGFSFLELD